VGMPDPFFEEEGSRLLKATAFEFVLHGEMKRAVRSQNFLTLVVLETQREWDGMTVTADDGGFVQRDCQIDRRSTLAYHCAGAGGLPFSNVAAITANHGFATSRRALLLRQTTLRLHSGAATARPTRHQVPAVRELRRQNHRFRQATPGY